MYGYSQYGRYTYGIGLSIYPSTYILLSEFFDSNRSFANIHLKNHKYATSKAKVLYTSLLTNKVYISTKSSKQYTTSRTHPAYNGTINSNKYDTKDKTKTFISSRTVKSFTTDPREEHLL